jgi:H2-forming N5,N10-methylenetetrahydromethanopterin dehydrogenase-like enzyme
MRAQIRRFSAAFAGFGGGIGRVYRDNEAERVCLAGEMRPIIRHRALRSALDVKRSALGVNWAHPPDCPASLLRQ